MPQLLRKTLIEQGVDESRIQVIPSEVDAVQAGLEASAKRDLLVILGDEIARCWKQIVHFNEGEDGVAEDDMPEPSSDFPEKLYEHQKTKFQLGERQRLVSDDRGVRLVVERGEDSD